ncbi:pseudouridine synthase [Helicobacter canadensis]|uniref:Pseudouridine synthase n=1 Tax=Helicobacter canadensis MIT 98-5491 TaxID=537970 RepID=C5ZWP9_9HELI|nr:pseudouridine synthase [Helicobacter canadensis]EES89567.1 pseudouridine synthase, Rsu [Helicobacter canadensis MIT 98-5491]EFR48358.1 pseudouridylate synthase [Helicobacter canadensis MIT 98-5491]STO99604.1 ribosomal pseudouridine synthase [Helicobacter canadensis]
MRLNQYIAHHSKFSRREADQLIKEGKVSINKEIIKDFSYQVKNHTKVYVNGKCLKEKEEYTVIVYNKPKGELVSKRDDRGRRVIYESLPKRFKDFIPIGRLDFASEGLLLLTDSVKVATKLMESKLERVYLLKLSGEIKEEVFEAMENGLSLQDARLGGHQKSKIKAMEFSPFMGYWVSKNTAKLSKIKVAINEGKNRELRRFFAHFNLKVLDLKRVAYGFVSLNNLPTQKVRFLERGEYNKLHKFLEED